MSWWNPASWGRGEDPNDVKEGARAGLNVQAGASGAFANLGQSNYDTQTGRLGAAQDYLGGLMRGENSVSAEQLRQGLQQNLAAQRSLAAAASPQNSAMAARTAAMQAGRLGAGLSGQQALAGIQERNAAAQAYGQLGLGMRGQDVNAALGARQNALNGYLGVLNGQQNQGWLTQNMDFIKGIGGMIMGGPSGGGGGK